MAGLNIMKPLDTWCCLGVFLVAGPPIFLVWKSSDFRIFRSKQNKTIAKTKQQNKTIAAPAGEQNKTIAKTKMHSRGRKDPDASGCKKAV